MITAYILVSQNLQKLNQHLKTRINVGVIHLVLPNEKMLTFSGKQVGPKVTWVIKDWQCIDDIVKEGPSALPRTHAKNLWTASNLVDFLTLCFQNDLLKFAKKQSFFSDWFKLFKTSTPYDTIFDQFVDQCCADQICQYRHLINHALPNTRILDMGCDGGNFAKFAARNGHHVTALTLSRQNYQKAKGVLQKDIDLGRVCLIQNARPHLSMRDEYDLITAFGLLEYMRTFEWGTLFKTIHNNLSKTGTVFLHSLFVPSHPPFCPKPVHHLQNYLFQNNPLPSLHSFKREAAKYGLDLVKSEPIGSGYINHLEKVFATIQKQTDANATLVYSLLYCCACLIAALKTGHANIAQVQLKHLTLKDNVVRLAI